MALFKGSENMGSAHATLEARTKWSLYASLAGPFSPLAARTSSTRKQDTMSDPVISRPFDGNEVPPIVNTLNQAPLPTLNDSPQDDVETVNNEIISED